MSEREREEDGQWDGKHSEQTKHTSDVHNYTLLYSTLLCSTLLYSVLLYSTQLLSFTSDHIRSDM